MTANPGLAENEWNAKAKRSEARVVHSFGRADQLDRAALQRLVASIQRVIDADAAGALPIRGKTAIPGFYAQTLEIFENMKIQMVMRIRCRLAATIVGH